MNSKPDWSMYQVPSQTVVGLALSQANRETDRQTNEAPTILRFHLTLLRMAIVRKTDNKTIQCVWGLYTIGGNVNASIF